MNVNLIAKDDFLFLSFSFRVRTILYECKSFLKRQFQLLKMSWNLQISAFRIRKKKKKRRNTSYRTVHNKSIEKDL